MKTVLNSFFSFLIAILLAPSSANAQELVYELQEPWPFDFACAVEDVNADGVTDFAGAYWNLSVNAHQSGGVRVYSGFDCTPIYTFLGENDYDHFGRSVAGVGDINGDGFAEILVGADSGGGKVFSGLNGTLLHDFGGGRYVAGAGDVNGDSVPDLALSGPGLNVYSGADWSLIHTVSGYGGELANVGDVNGDHVDDLGVRSGYANAYILSGADGSLLYSYSFTPPFPSSQYLISIDGAGDVDADGNADFIIGAWDIGGGRAPGAARVYSGVDGSALYTVREDYTSDRFGASVSGAGDVNGDGMDDVVVGMFGADRPADGAGGLRIFSGPDGSILCSLEGRRTSEKLGGIVEGLGDVNGDGRSDVLATDRDYAGGRPGGLIRAYSFAPPFLTVRVTGGPATALFRGDGFTPDVDAYLYYGRSDLQPTFVPALNVTLLLKNPVQLVGPTRTDAQGSVQWSVPIPNRAQGRYLWFQAAEDGLASNYTACLLRP